MKKIVNLVKNGVSYQIGPVTQAEINQMVSDISSVSATTTAHTTAITSIQTSLSNIYTKSETDTKIADAVGQIDTDVFIFANELPTSNIDQHKIYVVPKEEEVSEYASQYFTMVAKSDGNFQFVGSSNYDGDSLIQYSTDNGTTWSNASRTATVNVTNGDSVIWKGNLRADMVGETDNSFSASTASFDAQGNILSLLYGDNFTNYTDIYYASDNGNYVFRYLFASTKIENAENLVMPNGEANRATCKYMFANCTSLVKAPTIRFNYLSDASNFYSNEGMFSGCTNLNYIKWDAENVINLTNGALTNWVSGVAPSGTFVKRESLVFPTGVNGIPEGWTVETIAFDSNNVLVEWYWNSNGNKWEKIGEFKADVDLSGYYTKPQVDSLLSALDKAWFGTQAQFSALSSTDATKLYFIYEETI